MIHFSKCAAAAALAVAATGCSTQQKIEQLHSQTSAEAGAISAQAKQQSLDAERLRIAQQEVDKPYLVGKAVPLAREVSMPAAFRQKVTVLFDRGGVDLATAARQISEASRVAISVTSDALLPAATFGPRLAGQGAGAQIVPGVPGQAPTGASGGRITLSSLAQGVELYALLDQVARQASVSWRVTDAGAEFYRTETKVFRVNVSPQTATTTATLGRNSSNNQVFEAQSKTGFVLEKQDPLAGMRSTVEAMLTAGGRLTTSSESQTFVVTDTPQALARVEAYISEMNKAFARRVRIVVEAVEVVAKDNAQQSLDWNLVYKSLNASGGTAVTSAIASLATANAGSLTATSQSARFGNSTAAVKALSEVASIVNRRSFPFVTTSGRPITQALRNTFSYVDSTSLVQSSTITTVQQAPTVSQKEETVGTFLTVTPVAKDNGHIYLTLSYDVTTSDPLRSFTVGNASNSVTVQQKSINGTGIVQEVPMRSGQTVVVGGYDSVVANSTLRRLAPGAPIALGGSNSNEYTKSLVVFLVTAVTEDGY